MGQEEPDHAEELSCITVPPEMVTDSSQRFFCPECLSRTAYTMPDYIINRGSRATRRLAVKSSLVYIIFHLTALERAARALSEQLFASVAIFEAHVVAYVRQIGAKVHKSEADGVRKQLLPEAPYHLAVIILTESNPNGGWWISAKQDSDGIGCTPEREFLRYHLKELTTLTKDAVTSRVFVFSCGLNMFNNSTLGMISDTMTDRPWHSLIMPTAPSIVLSEALIILPELFVHLYYYSATLKSSLMRVWAKSPEVCSHTGFVLMDRASWQHRKPMDVIKLEHAPYTARPYGFDLPMVHSICGCWGKDPFWRIKHDSEAFGEKFFYYRSACCGSELHIAIFSHKRTLLHAHGTVIMQEEWDSNLKNFTFNESHMVHPDRKSTASKAERPTHNMPWTLAGKRASAAMCSSARIGADAADA